MVEVTGLEPTTSWSRTKRATKLRYTSKRTLSCLYSLIIITEVSAFVNLIAVIFCGFSNGFPAVLPVCFPVQVKRELLHWSFCSRISRSHARCDFSGSLFCRGGQAVSLQQKSDAHLCIAFLLVEVTGLEPTTSWSLTKRATKLRYTSVCFFAKQHNLLYMIFRKSKTILPAFREFFNFWMTLRPWPPSEQFWPFRHERGSKRKRPAGAGPQPAACSNCPNIERQRRLPPRPLQK